MTLYEAASVTPLSPDYIHAMQEERRQWDMWRHVAVETDLAKVGY